MRYCCTILRNGDQEGAACHLANPNTATLSALILHDLRDVEKGATVQPGSPAVVAPRFCDGKPHTHDILSPA
jgi:hypothetical protein